MKLDFYRDSGHRLKLVYKASKFRGPRYECMLCWAHTDKSMPEVKQMIHRAAPCNCGQAMLFDGNFVNAPAWRLES